MLKKIGEKDLIFKKIVDYYRTKKKGKMKDFLEKFQERRPMTNEKSIKSES